MSALLITLFAKQYSRIRKIIYNWINPFELLRITNISTIISIQLFPINSTYSIIYFNTLIFIIIQSILCELIQIY